MSGEENQFNVQGYNIVTILKRLEAATSRLEDITVFQEEANKHKNSTDSSSNNLIASQSQSDDKTALALKDSTTTTTTSTSEESAPEHKSVTAFRQFIEENVSPFVSNSKSIDPLVGESAEIFQQAFQDQIKFLSIVAQSQKPDFTDPSFTKLLTPLNEKITKINTIKDDNRRSNFFNHLNSLSESAAVLFWFGVPTPVSYVSDIKDSAKFWSDRVLKEYKDKDSSNVDWVNQLAKLFDNLKGYVKEYHTQGPSWNPKGKPFAQAIEDFESSSDKSTTSSSSSAPVSSSAPAPPPPPPASFFEETSSNNTSSTTPSEGGMNAVFAQLNQGSNVTSGLKKVDKSEMTHKNPELRKQPPVAPKKPKNLASTTSSSIIESSPSPVKKPAKKELVDGTKWIIQNFTQTDVSGPIVIEVEMHQSVFIGNCSDITLQLKGKANAVSISETKNIGIVVDSLISGVDIIKSFKYGVQVLGLVPMISIDKSDEGTIYLSNESIQNQCQVFTSSTTALNINVPEANNDFKELAVPEQFVSTIQNGKLVSQIVEHAG
ncbi:SRV2 [Candida jiufengensis]|uniref:SRV2 n=1 Tax=Candida jiufengensis TaxID=497108 RepID=UPI002225A2E9|nr:SRV2 [Candida jiufengensis]KAI5954306.1 SRV2 [Candida jiufengensis]